MSKSAIWMSSDKVLGIAGSGLAAASIGFGAYMTIHGPAPGSFGHSRDFTVFAQLAPRRTPASQPRTARAATKEDALDTAATASIPKRAADAGARESTADANGTLPSMTLEGATPDAATIAVGGRIQTVRIGDDVPGAGEVLEIRTRPHAVVRFSRGLIVATHQE